MVIGVMACVLFATKKNARWIAKVFKKGHRGSQAGYLQVQGCARALGRLYAFILLLCENDHTHLMSFIQIKGATGGRRAEATWRVHGQTWVSRPTGRTKCCYPIGASLDIRVIMIISFIRIIRVIRVILGEVTPQLVHLLTRLEPLLAQFAYKLDELFNVTHNHQKHRLCRTIVYMCDVHQ